MYNLLFRFGTCTCLCLEPMNPFDVRLTFQAIMAEGKQHAVAIGLMKMSSEEMYAQFFLFTFYSAVKYVIRTERFGSICGFDIKSLYFRLAKNKGIGVDNIHYIGDGLWHMQVVK